jgi:hypothetical protein
MNSYHADRGASIAFQMVNSGANMDLVIDQE